PTHRSTFLATGSCPSLFSFTAPATTEIYTLSLHDALPISWLTWYTGGLEAAIALHVVHNLAAFTLSAFEGTLAEAATGGGSWEGVVGTATEAVLFCSAVVLLARRRGLRRTAPGDPDAVQAPPERRRLPHWVMRP